MEGENTTAPDTGSIDNASAESNSGSGSSFSFDSWDGNSNSLPEEHKAAFAAFEKHSASRETAAVQNALKNALQQRYAEQDTKRRAVESRRPAGDSETPLTQAQLQRELAKREQSQARTQRIQSFRDGMLDIVGKPQQFGDATVTFSSNEEVAAFESWMSDMFNGKMTPSDMLKLYRHEQILQANSDAAVRKFEAKLKERKQGMTAGGSLNEPTQTRQRKAAPEGGSRRVPSLEDFIKSENPAAHGAITSGKVNILENL